MTVVERPSVCTYYFSNLIFRSNTIKFPAQEFVTGNLVICLQRHVATEGTQSQHGALCGLVMDSSIGNIGFVTRSTARVR